MTNTLEFELAIKRAGLTKLEVIRKLGISNMGLYKKINNITEFKASEIAKMYVILKFKSLDEQQKKFFAHLVDFKSA